MQRQKVLNRVLVILAASIIVLGASLALTVPAELKELARTRSERMFSGGGIEKGPEAGVPFRGFPRSGYYPHGHFFPVAGTILLLAVIGGFAMRRFAPRHGRLNEINAVEILREKYAAGEIGKDEYVSRKRVLENDTELE